MSHPQIDDARRLGKRDNDGKYGFSSYGRTRALCQSTGDIMDSIYEMIGERFAEANERGT